MGTRWFFVKAYSQDGHVFLEVRTPASTLREALTLASSHAENQARGSHPQGPALIVEVRPL